MSSVFLLEFTGIDDQHVIAAFSTEEKAQAFAKVSSYPSWDLVITEWELDVK